MKKLDKVVFPKDFKNPKTAVIGDEYINKLIKMLKMEADHFACTADTLVMLNNEGFVDIYKLVAQCEVEVNW